MEYVEFSSLDRIIHDLNWRYENVKILFFLILSRKKKRIKLNMLQRVRMARHCLQSLYKLHSNGIIHCDVKPAVRMKNIRFQF